MLVSSVRRSFLLVADSGFSVEPGTYSNARVMPPHFVIFCLLTTRQLDPKNISFLYVFTIVEIGIPSNPLFHSVCHQVKNNR